MGIEIDLVSVPEVEIDYVFVCGTKMTCLWYGDRLTWFLCGWSKMTCFLCAVRKGPGPSVSIETNLVFVWVVEIHLI